MLSNSCPEILLLATQLLPPGGRSPTFAFVLTAPQSPSSGHSQEPTLGQTRLTQPPHPHNKTMNSLRNLGNTALKANTITVWGIRFPTTVFVNLVLFSRSPSRVQTRDVSRLLPHSPAPEGFPRSLLVFSVSYVSDHHLLSLGREVEGEEVSSGRGKEGGRAMEGRVTEEGN